MKGKSAASVLAGLVVAASLAPAAAVAAAALSGSGHRWPDILAQFVGPAFLYAIVWTVAAGLMRRPRRALAGVASVALLLVAGWPQWSPPRGVAAAGAPAFTLYSANLWARNTDVEAMRRSIEAADADIVVLIELGDAPAARLDELLAGYPNRALTRRVDRPSGPARSVVASRWPLAALPPPEGDIHALPARIQTPGGAVTVVGVHLTRPWPFQYQWGQILQVRRLAGLRRELRGPVIMAGDFNAVSTARIGRQVRDDLDLIPARGWPGTWPSAAPSAAGITIDQVWRSPDLALLDRRLGRPTGSDHRPVITRFARSAP